jgi:outer membrane lipoprotein SlyB
MSPIAARIALPLAALATLAGASPALAKGCLKGAAIGGVAGHYVGKGHAVAGAVVGCWYGHHRAVKAAKAQQAQAHAQHR